MHVAFIRNEEPVKVKKQTRKQQVDEFAKMLRAKWEARDRAEAIKKYGLTPLNKFK